MAAADLRRVLARQHLELQLPEERVRGRVVGAREPQRVEVERDRRRRAAASRAASRAAPPRDAPSSPRGRRRASPCRRSRARPRPTRTRAPGRGRPCRRCPATPGHVVDRVADERQHVHDPLGRHAPLLLDRAAVVARASRCPRGPGSAPARAPSTSCSRSLSPETTTTSNPAARPPGARASRSRRPPRSPRPRAPACAAPRTPAGCRAAAAPGRCPSAAGWPCTRCTRRGGRSCRAGRRRPPCARGFSSSSSLRSIVVKP